MILETAKMAVKLPDKTYADFILRGVNQFYRKHTRPGIESFRFLSPRDGICFIADFLALRIVVRNQDC